MIFSCRKASQLMSEELDRELSGLEKFKLYGHLALCRYCRRAIKHLRLLQEIGAGLMRRREAEVAEEKLPPETRENILTGMKE